MGNRDGYDALHHSGAEANNAQETNSLIAKYAAAIYLVISTDHDIGNRNRFVTNPA